VAVTTMMMGVGVGGIGVAVMTMMMGVGVGGTGVAVGVGVGGTGVGVGGSCVGVGIGGTGVAVGTGVLVRVFVTVLVGMEIVVRVGVAVSTTISSTIGAGVPKPSFVLTGGHHHGDVTSKITAMSVMSARVLTQGGVDSEATLRVMPTKALPPFESTST